MAAIFKNPIWLPLGILKIWKHWFLVSVVLKYHLDAKIPKKGQQNYIVAMTNYTTQLEKTLCTINKERKTGLLLKKEKLVLF